MKANKSTPSQTTARPLPRSTRVSPNGTSISSSQVIQQLFKGMPNSRPVERSLVPFWSINVELRAFAVEPFEPLHSIFLEFLTCKTLFLVPQLDGEVSSRFFRSSRATYGSRIMGSYSSRTERSWPRTRPWTSCRANSSSRRSPRPLP